MNTPLLSLRKIRLTLPSKQQPLLDELSLDVFQGDFITLVGSNGCGKSSLIKIINGLFYPAKGDLLFNGQSLLQHRIYRRARDVITLTQDLNLTTFSELTVLENCLIALHRNKKVSLSFTKRTEKDQIRAYLESYNPVLCDKLHERVSSLSGGERQTLALAMSLWNTPKLLLLDEHTSALDPQMAQKIMELTYRAAKQNHVTVIAVTHRLNDALAYGNRLLMMKQGKIVLDLEDKSEWTEEMLFSLYLKG